MKLNRRVPLRYFLGKEPLLQRRVQVCQPRNQKREFKVGDKIRVNLHHGKIEDAIVRAVIQHTDGTKTVAPQLAPCM